MSSVAEILFHENLITSGFFPVPAIKTEASVDSQSHHLLLAGLQLCSSGAQVPEALVRRAAGFITVRRETVEKKRKTCCLTPWQAAKDKCKGICRG